MRIIYFLDQLNKLGGIEQVIKFKAEYFAEIKNYDVYIVVSYKEENINYTNISKKVKIINLNLNKKKYRNYLTFILNISKLKIKQFRLIQRVCKKIKPDIVISPGLSEKNLIPFLKGDFKKIREFHFPKNYRDYINKEQKIYVLIAKIADFIDNNIILRSFDSIVTLTQEDKIKNWSKWHNIKIIPNPITTLPNQRNEDNIFRYRTAIAVGRLVEQKNFSTLVRIWVKVVLKYPDWKLKIFGEGPLNNILHKEILDQNMTNNIILMGRCNDHNEIYNNASFLLSCSVFEGFPLVFLESMSFGIPVIAYDCPCGPKEIINDGINGFLVPMGDEDFMLKRIFNLIENADLNLKMRKASIKTTDKFKLSIIMNNWIELFNTLLY